MAAMVTTERRSRERVSAERGAWAFSGNHQGQILDVNLQGLCFQYTTEVKQSVRRDVQKGMGEGTVDIVFGAYDFSLVGLPVETVADYQIAGRQTAEGWHRFRRRVVTFGQLSPEQLFELKRFLLLNRYGAIPPAGKPMKKENGSRS